MTTLAQMLTSLTSFIADPPQPYPTIGLDHACLSEQDKTTLKGLIAKIGEVDETCILTLTTLNSMFYSGILPWSVKAIGDAVVLHVGNNFIQLQYNSALNTWETPAGSKLNIGVTTNEQKVEVPFFELVLDDGDYLKISISWQDSDKMLPSDLKKLRSFVTKPKMFVGLLKSPLIIPSPIYSLVLHAEKLPVTGATFKIHGFRTHMGNFGLEHHMILDPAYLPIGTMRHNKTGRDVTQCLIRAQGISENILSADGAIDEWNKAAKSESGAWLIVTGIRTLPNGNLSPDHAIMKNLPSFVEQFKPTLIDPPNLAQLQTTAQSALADAKASLDED